MTTQTVKLSAEAVSAMIEGSNNMRRPGAKITAFVKSLSSALKKFRADKHTGIDVTVPKAGADAMYKLLAAGQERMFDFDEVFNKINEVRADLHYGGRCTCCGKRTDHNVLIQNKGYCLHRNCVLERNA